MVDERTVGERRAVGATLGALLVVGVVAQLVAAWWFPQNVLARTPLVDVTPLEVTAAAGAVLLLSGRAWRLVRRPDLPWLVVLVAYLGWYPLAAVLRGTPTDLKPVVAGGFFLAAAAATAFAATRVLPHRALRWMLAALGGALAIALALALLERLTFPGPGLPDPLEPFWRLFRPYEVYIDPRLGQVGPPRLHYPLWEGTALRATGAFFHTNYQAFFGILLAPLATAVALVGLRARDRRMFVLGVVGLALAWLVTYWTYSRAGLLGLVAAIAAAIVLDVIWQWRDREDGRGARRMLGPAMTVAVMAAVLGGATLLTDDLGVRRLAATDVGDPVVSDGPDPGDALEGSAARAGALRLHLQRVAIDRITDTPRALAFGSGLDRYAAALHDPASPSHTADARGIREPNSLWLTAGLAGGLPAVALLALLLAVTWLRLLRALPREPDRWRRAAILWLAAWLPAWAVIQLAGTNPFSAAEAMILGSMLGLAAGLSYRPGVGAPDRADAGVADVGRGVRVPA
jgi:hypothetical protein